LKYNFEGNLLFSGARKDNNIFVWDLRKLENPLISYYIRNSNTNQKMIFDISEFGNLLATGCTNGEILIFDTMKNAVINSFSGHYDSVVCTQFCPISDKILLTASGQRHYEKNYEKTEDFELSGDEEKISETDKNFRNGIRIWNLK